MQISSDHVAVDALEDYDLPWRLVVYANGKTHRIVGEGPPIFSWHFVDGGRRVAIGATLTHGTCVEDWFLWDIEPQRRLAYVTNKHGCPDDDGTTPLPRWIDGMTSGLN